MTCEESLTLLHLHRPGERSETEERELERHLRTCERCGEEAAMIDRTRLRFDQLREVRLNIRPDVAGIIDAIERADRGPRLDWVIRIAGRRSVRFAYAFVVTGTLLAFADQVAPPSQPDDSARDRGGKTYVAVNIAALQPELPEAKELPADVRETIRNFSGRELPKHNLRRVLERSGQVAMQTMRLTDDERRLIELLYESMEHSSTLHIRFSLNGG